MSDNSVHNGNIIINGKNLNGNYIININNNDDVNHGKQLLNKPVSHRRRCYDPRRKRKSGCGNKGRNHRRNHQN